jgi:hypothetical protein
MLTAGAFYLFTINNPFMNKNPKFFLTGITVCVISAGYFAGSTQLICNQQTDDDFVFNKGVEYYSVSPDGEFVFVQTCTDGFIRRSYLLDSSGTLLLDFGKNSSAENYGLLWGFNSGRKMLSYMIEKPILSEISRDRYVQSFILDLDSRNRYKVKSSFDSGMYDYKIINNGTMELIGIGKEGKSNDKRSLYLFKRSILTGRTKKIQITNTEGVNSYDVKFIDIEHLVVSKALKDEKSSGADENIKNTQIQLNIIDLKGQKISDTLLPKGVGYEDYLVNNDKCYFLQRLTDEDGYSYKVASRMADKKDEIHIKPEELPRYAFREAAEGKHFISSIDSSPNKKWVMFKYQDMDKQYQLVLLDSEGNKIKTKIKKGRVDFTPTEERLMVHSTSYGENDSGSGSIQLYDISGQQMVFVKEFEVEDNSNNYKFLDNDVMLYVKNPTPGSMWGNDRYLARLNLKTMESISFFRKKEVTADK